MTHGPASRLPVVRPLTRADAAAFRALRLEALRLAPEAFGSSYEDEADRDEAAFAARIPEGGPEVVFGAFLDGPEGARLVGMAGLHGFPQAKQRHKGVLWGMYVRAESRGRGLAAALVEAVVAHARAAGLEQIQLHVATGNARARALYEAAGFRICGLERRALKIGPGDYRDDHLLALFLTGDDPS